ncbi:MAG TPA: prepilin-type N-terminal cleavage/methylation domain-containing protein [Bryobacteraceae bacterium]
MSSERGVTFLELIIAITLVAAIVAGLLFAMRGSLLTYEKVNGRLEEDTRLMRMTQALERQIGGTIPSMGACGAGRVPVFNGDAQSLRFVSSYSLEEGARGYARLVEYQVEPDPQSGVRLMMNERVYAGPASTGPLCAGNVFLPVQIDAQSIEAVGRLAYCRISYREFVADNPPAGHWVTMWNRPALPGAVRIEMAPLPGSERSLPVMSLNVPIHIFRELGVQYEDN